MNLKQALARARNILADGGITDAPLESEILLRHATGLDRARLYANLSLEMNRSQEKKLHALLERRLRGEPSSYITGHREFYGLDFHVDRHVLIPRPETELLVEKVIELARANDFIKIADIGTGCGAIAVSLTVNLPQVIVYATDISPAALETARINSKRHGVADRVVFLCGDLLRPLPEPVNIIAANLPYVKKSDLRNIVSLRHEPALALNGGQDGLDSIRSLCRQSRQKLKKNGFLLLETGEGQADTVIGILCKAFPTASPEVYRDLASIERVVCLRLT